jgi:TetR/AcrR family transcriptional repressor of nem operon
MARTREYDDDTVLEKAAALFWRRGYAVVSIQELEAATGLGRGSLYNAFGDKEGLFIAAIDRYAERFGAAPFRHLANPDVRLGIQRLLEAIVARMADPANPRGCLLTNTSLAFGTGLDRIDSHVGEKIAAMETLLEQAIARAREDGQIPAGADPKPLARFYSGVAQSLGVMHKAFGDVGALRDIVAVAMRAWPAAEPAPKRADPAKARRRPARRR